MKSFVIILALVSAVFSNTIITTKYRTDLDLTTGKAITSDYVSTFEIQEGRFVHSAPGITSIYVAKTSASTFEISGTQLVAIPCRSEAMNEYLYVFDMSNKRVYVMTSDGTRLIQYDISDVTTN